MENREGIGALGLKTKLIVNYIPQSMTDGEFHQIFSQCGVIQGCKIIRDKHSNYSFGYGFVDYSNPNDALNAITKLNGYQIQNKTLKVAFSKPPGSSKNANLYVTGLGKSTTEQRMKEIFSVYGDVIQTKILKEKDGSSKEVGFVLFKETPHADNAIKSLQGYADGYGMNLQIKYAKDQNDQQRNHPKYQEFYNRTMQQQQHQQMTNTALVGGYAYNLIPYSNMAAVGTEYGGGYGGKVARGRGAARYNPIARPHDQMGGQQVQHTQQMYNDPQQQQQAIVLFVYNIGPNAQDSDLYALFCKYGRILKVNVIPGKGYGFVHMPVPAEAQSAVDSLNGIPYNGKILQVSIKTNK